MSFNGKSTLEKGGRDPPDKSLEYIVNDLLAYLNNIDKYRDAKQEAEDKYGIKNEHDNCWPVDDIKRAWGKTMRMKETSPRRRHWSIVVMMQVIERQIKRKGKRQINEVDELSDLMDAGENPKRKKVISENRSSQRICAEQGTMGAAGGANQCSGGNHQTSSFGQTGVSQSRTGTPNTGQRQNPGNNPGGNNRDVSTAGGLNPKHNNNRLPRGTVYIRVPISELIPNRQSKFLGNVLLPESQYKLMAALPKTNLNSDTRRRKSYVMSFNRETKNANWVYEILNKQTLDTNPLEADLFGRPYHRGHLAAAANHRWCREARNDADMIDNIVPQHSGLNTGAWLTLERYCRTIIRDSVSDINVHVYSGPLYLREMNPRVIQEKKVPSHFFKVIIVENERGRIELPQCYVLPNKNVSVGNINNIENLAPYKREGEERDRTIEDIENLSRVTFSEHKHNVGQNKRANKITGTLHGADGNTVPRTADIRVTTIP